MYPEKGGKHKMPHFHAAYQDHTAAITFDGEVLEGSLPNSKLKLVTAWAEIHKDNLLANWTLLSQGERIFKIDPLR